MTRPAQAAEEAAYAIRVRGHVPAAWHDWFDGWQVANLPDGQATLEGLVADQAALHGVLARLRDLNLELMELRRLPVR